MTYVNGAGAVQGGALPVPDAATAPPMPAAEPGQPGLGPSTDLEEVYTLDAGTLRARLSNTSTVDLSQFQTRIAETLEEAAEEVATHDPQGIRVDGAPGSEGLERSAQAVEVVTLHQLEVLNEWVARTMLERSGTPVGAPEEETALCRRWDARGQQARVALAAFQLHEARLAAAGEETPELTLARTTLQAAVVQTELSMLHRAADALEEQLLAQWLNPSGAIGGARLPPENARASVAAYDGLQLVRYLAGGYPRPEDRPLPLAAEGSPNAQIECARANLAHAAAIGLMHDRLLEHYPLVESLAERVEALRRAVPDDASNTYRGALERVHAFLVPLREAHSRYISAVTMAHSGLSLHRDAAADDAEARSERAQRLRDMLPAAHHYTTDGDSALSGAERFADEAVESLKRCTEPKLTALLEPVQTLCTELDFRPAPEMHPLDHAATLPVAALAHAVAGFTRLSSGALDNRLLAAAQHLLRPDALQDRLFVEVGPGGVPLAQSR